jgi:hypothetical protein
LTRLHKRDLQLVLDKLANKLAHWKTRPLSKEGRQLTSRPRSRHRSCTISLLSIWSRGSCRPWIS